MQELKDRNPILIQSLAGFILFVSSVQVLTIGLSLIHIRIDAWLARAILVTAIAIAALFVFWKNDWRGELPDLTHIRGWQWAFLGFLTFAVVSYLLLWLMAIISPDLSYDGNAYHIPTLALWDAKGYITWIHTTYQETFINGYPKGAELISYIFVKAFGNPVINTVNLIFLPLGILGIASLAFIIGAGRKMSLCAGAAFLLIPININQSITTYVDTAFAASAIGFIAMVAFLCQSPNPKWKNALITGAAMGLALSTKSTGVALCGLGLLALGITWVIDRFHTSGDMYRGTKIMRWLKAVIQMLPWVLLILGVALLTGGYWYIRNSIYTGSPLYPVGLTFLGHTIFPGTTVAEVLPERNVLPMQFKTLSPPIRILYAWAQGLQNWPLSIKGYDSRLAGLGFLWLIGCVPAVVIAFISAIRSKPNRIKILSILLAIVAITFSATHLNWWARYTIWVYSLGLPCLAIVLDQYVIKPVRWKVSRLIASLWMTICIGLVIFEAGYCLVDVTALASPGSLRGNLTHLFNPDTWTWPTTYLFPDMKGTVLETVLDQKENVALGPHGGMDWWRYVGFVGQLSQPIGARQLIFIDGSPGTIDSLKQTNIKYVLWDESLPLPESLKRMASSITQAGGYTILTLP
jgi:hypothetical protein